MKDANNGIKTCLTQHIVRSISIIASENVCDTIEHTHTRLIYFVFEMLESMQFVCSCM